MRKALDTLYNAAGYLAAFFMIGILAMVLASVVGRLAGFNLRGSDAYAGYCMAAASFLALCRSTRPKDVVAGARDAVTRAYFRELSPAEAPAPLAAMGATRCADSPARWSRPRDRGSTT